MPDEPKNMAPTDPPPCECGDGHDWDKEKSLYCTRHKIRKTRAMVELCKKDPRWRRKWDAEKDLDPPPTKPATHPTATAWDIEEAAAQFAPSEHLVDPEEYHRRLKVCDACGVDAGGHRVEATCAHIQAGCNLLAKAQARNFTCPIGRWDDENRDDTPAAIEPASPQTPENVGPKKGQKNRKPKDLLLVCRLAPGDVLTMTAAVESLHATYPGHYRTAVETTCPAIWENNPHIEAVGSGAQRIEMKYPAIHQSNVRSAPFLAGYTEFLGDAIGLPLRLTVNAPRLYLSQAEIEARSQVEDLLADQLAGRSVPYGLIDAGVKADFTAKQWPCEYYQEVVSRTIGRVWWVQIGATGDDHPKLDGVVDLRGRTTHRQLITLAAKARLGLGPVTLLQHLMAAWGKPYICLAGGRESIPWISGYPLQHTLHTVGTLPCCSRGGCWAARVIPSGQADGPDRRLCQAPVPSGRRPVAACMTRIRPGEVLAILDRIIF